MGEQKGKKDMWDKEQDEVKSSEIWLAQSFDQFCRRGCFWLECEWDPPPLLVYNIFDKS